MAEGSGHGGARLGVRLGDQGTYAVLRTLAANAGPVGCWRVRDALRADGVEVSEATVGRLLRELDYRGLSERVGAKSGRVLTPQGRRELAALEQSQREDAYRAQFLQAIRAESAADVLDLLNIRRAVESETARLAASRATTDELARLERAVREHTQAVLQGGPGTEENNRFHLLLAQAAKSRAASAVVALILHDRHLHGTLVGMQRGVGSLVPEEHQRVLEAVRERRPAQAAEAMRAHIDRLIHAVEEYAASRAAAGAGSEARPSTVGRDSH